MDKETRKNLKKVAKREHVTELSFIWLLGDVFSDGSVKSKALCDVPDFVIADGLVEEKERGLLDYTPWKYTFKACQILSPFGS